ncbi:hypothetical protein NDU88_004770 [Pleurodeles waltl]|uniref:Uncharacterized protein n=1 Tax=Pleurodeles waltl TaxID=8319 RepID=A0AAV7V244_PLEWA|nr:hypothetical protein NDU88_004770 [Pleurodeles waltl]
MEETNGVGERVKSRTAEAKDRRRVGKHQDLSPTTWRAAGARSRVDSTMRRGSLAPGSRRMSRPRFRRSVDKPGTATRDGRENGAEGGRRTGKKITGFAQKGGRNHTPRGGEEEIHGGDRLRRRESQEQNSRGQGPKTSWKTPGPVSNNLESSGSPEPCGIDNAKRITGPGKQTNEPATLQEKSDQARYGNSGREGKQSGGRRTGKKITGFAQKGVSKRKSRVLHKRG